MAYIIIKTNGGEEIGRQELSGPLLLGRASDCDLSFHDILLSRRHCRLQPVRGGWQVIDLASKNGTYINARRLDRSILSDGDKIRIGEIRIIYRAGAFAPPPGGGDGGLRVRAADPIEALSGTVMAMEMDEPALQPPTSLNGRPTPRPAPVAPAGYTREGVGAMVLDMLSDLHDSAVMTAIKPRKRPIPRPIIREIPAVRPQPQRMADLGRPADLPLQVNPYSVPLQPLQSNPLSPLCSEPVEPEPVIEPAARPAARLAPTPVAAEVPAELCPEPRPALVAPPATARSPRPARAGRKLDLCMAGLMLLTACITIVSSWLLLRMD